MNNKIYIKFDTIFYEILSNKLTYFTSWDANLFLCLVSLGLPGDLVGDFVKKIRRVHRKFELEGSRDFHCDRAQFVDMSGWHMLYYSRAELSDRVWHFPKAISRLGSITVAFHNRYSALVEHFTSVSRYLLSTERINFIELSGSLDCLYCVREEWGMDWSQDAIKWMLGFHPGRFLLMDLKYINELPPTIHQSGYLPRLWRVDNVDRFIEWFNNVFKGKKHIEDLLEERLF